MSVRFQNTPLPIPVYQDQSNASFGQASVDYYGSIDAALGLDESSSFQSDQCSFAGEAKNPKYIGSTPNDAAIKRAHMAQKFDQITTKTIAPIPPTPLVESYMWSDLNSIASMSYNQGEEFTSTTLDVNHTVSRLPNTPIPNNSLKSRNPPVDKSHGYSGPTTSFLAGSGPHGSASKPLNVQVSASQDVGQKSRLVMNSRDSDVDSVGSEPSFQYSTADHQQEIDAAVDSLTNTPHELRCDSTPIANRSAQTVGRPGHTPAPNGFYFKNSQENMLNATTNTYDNRHLYKQSEGNSTTSKSTNKLNKSNRIPLGSSMVRSVNESKSVIFEDSHSSVEKRINFQQQQQQQIVTRYTSNESIVIDKENVNQMVFALPSVPMTIPMPALATGIAASNTSLNTNKSASNTTSLFTSMTMTPSMSQSVARSVARSEPVVVTANTNNNNATNISNNNNTATNLSSKLSISSSSDRSGLSLSHLAVDHPSPERDDNNDNHQSSTSSMQHYGQSQYIPRVSDILNKLEAAKSQHRTTAANVVVAPEVVVNNAPVVVQHAAVRREPTATATGTTANTSKHFSLDLAEQQSAQPLLPVFVSVSESAPNLHNHHNQQQTALNTTTGPIVTSSFVSTAPIQTSMSHNFVSMGKGPTRGGVKITQPYLHHTQQQHQQQQQQVLHTVAPQVQVKSEPQSKQASENTSSGVNKEGPLAWEPLPNTLHLPKDWYTARKTRKDASRIHGNVVIEGNFAQRLESAAVQSEVTDKMETSLNNAHTSASTSTSMAVACAPAPVVTMSTPAISLTRYLSIPQSVGSSTTMSALTCDNNTTTLATAGVVAKNDIAQCIVDDVSALNVSCQVDSAALNAAFALNNKSNINEVDKKKQMVEIAVQSSFEGTPLKLFTTNNEEVQKPAAVVINQQQQSQLVETTRETNNNNIINNDNDNDSYCLQDLLPSYLSQQLVASYLSTPTKSPRNESNTLLADLSPLSVDDHSQQQQQQYSGRSVASINAKWNSTNRQVEASPLISILAQQKMQMDKKKFRKNISFDTQVCFVPSTAQQQQSGQKSALKAHQYSQRAREMMEQSPLGAATRIPISNNSHNDYNNTKNNTAKHYRQSTPWKTDRRQSAMTWDYLKEYESEYDNDNDKNEIEDEDDNYFPANKNNINRGDITILTDIAVASFTERDLDTFTIDSRMTHTNNDNNIDNDNNYNDEQSMCNTTFTTFTVDSPAAMNNTDNNMPTLAIRSLKREQDNPLSVKEIDFCTSPGEFTTVMLSLQNHRKKSFELISDCVSLRVEPLYRDRQQHQQQQYQQLNNKNNEQQEEGEIFSVSPQRLTVAPNEQAVLFITFSPRNQCEGIHSGVLRIRCGKKAYTLLLRGESSYDYSVSSPSQVHADQNNNNYNNDVVVHTPVQQHRNSLLQTPATVFQEKLKFLQEKIADISKRVLWTDNCNDEECQVLSPQQQQQFAAPTTALTLSPNVVVTESNTQQSPITSTTTVVNVFDVFPMSVSFSPVNNNTSNTSNNTNIDSMITMSQVLTINNNTNRPRIVRLSSSMPNTVILSTTLATIMPNSQYKVVVRLDKLTPDALASVASLTRHRIISKHSLYCIAEIVCQCDGVTQSIPVNVNGSMLKPVAASSYLLSSPSTTTTTVNYLTNNNVSESPSNLLSSPFPFLNKYNSNNNNGNVENVNENLMMTNNVERNSSTQQFSEQLLNNNNNNNKSIQLKSTQITNETSSSSSSSLPLYFRKSVALFGHVSIGNLVRTKVELCNASSQELRVRLMNNNNDNNGPFVLLHEEVIMRPRSFLRLPVRFVPTIPGEFNSQLMATTTTIDGQQQLTAHIALSGSAYL